jgi:hypothetical protein
MGAPGPHSFIDAVRTRSQHVERLGRSQHPRRPPWKEPLFGP